jgi:methylmalonyl-CoA/ethylmalonyl-CoA epimerase
MSIIKKVNHVAVVVEDIDQALAFWRDALGLHLQKIEDVPSEKVKVAFLPVGDSEVELVQPKDEESGISKFLHERGPGLHHMCFEVEDIDPVLLRLKSKGIRVINETPIQIPGRKMAFIHPKSTMGVLVELYQLTD